MNLKIYILRDLFKCSYDEKKIVFWILFYIIFSLYNIWFIDYEKELNDDLCLGEKYTYKSWFACICIVINKVYMVTTWSNNSHTTK